MPVILRGRSKQKSELEMQTLVLKAETAAEARETQNPNPNEQGNEEEKEAEAEDDNGMDQNPDVCVDEEDTESFSDFEAIQEEGEEEEEGGEYNLQKMEEVKPKKTDAKTLEELIVNWCVLRQESTDNFSTRLLYTLPVCLLGLFTFAWRICFNYFLLCFCLALTIAILLFLIFCAPFHLTYRFISNRFRSSGQKST